MKEKKKGKRIKSMNGEIWLPEEVIQRIQSFLTGKEASRTTILSKSWYAAWLTRPTIDLDQHYFRSRSQQPFDEFVNKTMRRYQDSSLKIESFRLRSSGDHPGDIIYYHNLVAKAMKMGATYLQLELPRSFTLRQEGSETLLRLSVCGFDFDGRYMSCSSLKSLSLENVIIRDNTFSCCNSLEELSLTKCCGLETRQVNLNEVCKLKRLLLDSVDVHDMVFTEFASRFPCLKDFTLHNSHDHQKIDVASTSLQTITFKNPSYVGPCANFDVPNIKKFTCSASCLPNLSVEKASREWEFDISIALKRLDRTSSFLNLKRLLKKCRLSRISLYIRLEGKVGLKRSEHKVDTEVAEEPLVVENLMIVAPPTFRYALLLRLFMAFRPKFLTLLRLAEQCDANFDTLCKRLMHQVITPNCRIPDQDVFWHFGVKKVRMEKDYEKYEDGYISGTKTRFELIWE